MHQLYIVIVGSKITLNSKWSLMQSSFILSHIGLFLFGCSS